MSRKKTVAKAGPPKPADSPKAADAQVSAASPVSAPEPKTKAKVKAKAKVKVRAAEKPKPKALPMLAHRIQRPGRTLPNIEDTAPVDVLWRILEEVETLASDVRSGKLGMHGVSRIIRAARARWRVGDLRQDNTLKLVGER